jgi:hypothetical protein
MSSQSSVPFWLQILSIALAPVFGFAGVAIGVFLSERNRHSAYIKDERLKAYRHFLETSSQVTAFFTPRFSSAVTGTRDPDKIRALVQELMTLIEKTQHAYTNLRLIGSPMAVRMAHNIFKYLHIGGNLAQEAIRGKFDQESWRKHTDEGTSLQNLFAEVARRDLGLPRNEWERSISKLTKEANTFRKSKS